jgi:hypothetical protein
MNTVNTTACFALLPQNTTTVTTLKLRALQSSYRSVTSSKSVLLTITIRTQQTQISQAVITAITIYVIHDQYKWFVLPNWTLMA